MVADLEDLEKMDASEPQASKVKFCFPIRRWKSKNCMDETRFWENSRREGQSKPERGEVQEEFFGESDGPRPKF